MRIRGLFALGLLTLLSGRAWSEIAGEQARAFVGQDLYLTGPEVISYQPEPNEAGGRRAPDHILVFQDGFSMSIGANQFSSDGAVVWLETTLTEFRNHFHIDYKAMVYLKDNVAVSSSGSARTTALDQVAFDAGGAMVLQFGVTGEVFVTAEIREVADPCGMDLYADAVAAVRRIKAIGAKVPGPVLPEEQMLLARPGEAVAAEQEKGPRFRYPVNLAPIGETPPQVELAKAADGTDIATVIGRFYLWQKQDEKGGLLEFQADNAVIFYSGREPQSAEEPTSFEGYLAQGGIKAIYVCGNVLMTEGLRIIRADEIYYNFEQKKALILDAEMRNFDVKRAIPVYLRAERLRQAAEDTFEAENVTVTTSEFYMPQISLTAAKVVLVDTTTVDEQSGGVSDSSYDAQMHDVRMKIYDKTIFSWPYMRSNLERPDVPLKSMHAGHSKTWGTSLETRWYLARLLGYKESEGTDSTLAVDYYSKRGLGAGADIGYAKEDYFGSISSYVIDDYGEDRLGRDTSRKGLKPPHDIRGRFQWMHRQFLPYNWQATTEVSYMSDEHFLEQFYRGEYSTGKEQETLLHLKRSENNWGLAFLGKARLNDFADELEEMPSAEFHWTGKSLFDDRFTLYSDTEIARLRQRIGNQHGIIMDEGGYAYGAHRTELDMPFIAGRSKVVPFVAGSFGYDDRSGFRRTLVDGSNTGPSGDKQIWIGETGLRFTPQPLWKVYPDVQSRLWDLNQLRHIIEPRSMVVLYAESDSVAEQRDILNVGLSQRLQTKRGSGDELRTVDWMRFDTDFVWVSDSDKADSSGPDKLTWNNPIVPTRVMSAPAIFNSDLIPSARTFEMYGPRRDYFATDYVWRITDTSAVLSDMHYDMQSGVVEQFNAGIAHMRWPNLSYYVGTRYLKRVEIAGEKGSNAVTAAVTYMLDPRYTVVFSQQYDFDYGANVRSDVTLVRRYHRVYMGLTFSADSSLDQQSVMLSLWPQGVPEMAIGSRRYMSLSEPAY